MNDPILDELRRIRDEHAARFNYDLRAIYADLKEYETKLGLEFVNGVAVPSGGRPDPVEPSTPSIEPNPEQGRRAS